MSTQDVTGADLFAALAGSGAEGQTFDRPTAVGWWWLARKSKDVWGSDVWWWEAVQVFEDHVRGLFIINSHGGGTCAAIEVRSLVGWSLWAGPLTPPPLPNAPISDGGPVARPEAD